MSVSRFKLGRKDWRYFSILMIAFIFVFWCGNLSVFSASVIVSIELVSNGIEITGADKIFWHTETEDMVENRKGVDIQKENGVKYMNSWIYAVLYANFSSLKEEKVNKQ